VIQQYNTIAELLHDDYFLPHHMQPSQVVLEIENGSLLMINSPGLPGNPGFGASVGTSGDFRPVGK
jgi:hypothetical protein